MAFKLNDYRSEVNVDWCPGCGDFGILSALEMALNEMQIAPHNVAIFSGIGCSGKTPHFTSTYGIHTLHGRVLPYAIGAKLTNPNLEVIAVGGDGDGLGIGVGHMVNAGRRNLDITYIIYNNGVYGLTKGQASPTLKLGLKTKSLTQPNLNQSINPVVLAAISGYTFIARSYAYDVKHLREMIRRGVEHKGLAFIEVLQPCPTYNDISTKEWFEGYDRPVDKNGKPQHRLYKLNEIEFDPIVHNELELDQKLTQIVLKSSEWGDKIPIGIFYINRNIPNYQERISQRIPNYKELPPAKQQIQMENGLPNIDLNKLLDELSTKLESKTVE